MGPCYICRNTDFVKVEGKVRDLPDINIFRCSSCGLVFLENFDHISDNFYNHSKMREYDASKEWNFHLNECYVDDLRRAELMKPLVLNKTVLDFGCGGGGFLLQIKNVVSKCEGIELDDTFREILNKQSGIKVYEDINSCGKKYDVITMFHVLEHLKDPKAVLKEISKFLNPGGSIIIEVPNADDALITLYKNKPFSEFTYWSCHLFLFNNRSIRMLFEDSGFKINYIKQIQRYSISNHLYWLSNGKPGGHLIWNFLDNINLNTLYEQSLVNNGIADTILTSISLKK